MAPVDVFVDWRPRWCFVEARWMAEDAWIEHHLMPRDFHPATPVAPVARRPGHAVSVGPPPGRHGHVIARVPFRSAGATAVIASFQDASGGRRRRAPRRFAVPDLGE